MEKTNEKIWVISNGRTGVRNQCIGVAQRLSDDIEIIKQKDIDEAGGLLPYLKEKFGTTQLATTDQWPDIVISSGLEVGKTNTEIKKLSGDKVFSVSVTNPTTNFFEFDVIATVKHTYFNWPLCSRTLEIMGVPHKVTPEIIEKEVEKWHDRFKELIQQRPVFAALVGGDTEDEKFSERDGITLGTLLNDIVKREGGSLLLTNSPRISIPAWRALLQQIDVPGFVYDCRVASQGNPFMAMLGVADVIIPTGDSVSMCFEATAAGKPVYIYYTENTTPDLYKKIYQDLYDRGLAQELTADFRLDREAWKNIPPPIDSAGDIATAVREELDKKRQASLGK